MWVRLGEVEQRLVSVAARLITLVSSEAVRGTDCEMRGGQSAGPKTKP